MLCEFIHHGRDDVELPCLAAEEKEIKIACAEQGKRYDSPAEWEIVE